MDHFLGGQSKNNWVIILDKEVIPSDSHPRHNESNMESNLILLRSISIILLTRSYLPFPFDASTAQTTPSTVARSQ